jgi:integrase
MRGSVKKDASGRWGYVFDVRTADGGRKQVRRRGFDTKKAAEADMRDRMTQAQGGTLVKPTRDTLERFLLNVWMQKIAGEVRPTTADIYARIVRKHIVPFIGTAQLQALTEEDVANWIDELKSSGLSPKSIRNIHGVLSSALSDAMSPRMGRLVARNVARPGSDEYLPRPPKRRDRAWTADQLQRFLAHVEGDRLAAMWRLAVMTGMRRGELLGLRWAAVDLDAKSVTVLTARVVAGGSAVEGPPKTGAGERTIALDAATAAALKRWKRQQNEERILMGAGWHHGDYVFAHATGEPLWPQTVTAQFKRHAEALGLPAIGVHGLRHSAATWMIAKGVSPKVVAQRLGHSHVSVTLQLYSHVMPAHDAAAAEAFAEALER